MGGEYRLFADRGLRKPFNAIDVPRVGNSMQEAKKCLESCF